MGTHFSGTVEPLPPDPGRHLLRMLLVTAGVTGRFGEGQLRDGEDKSSGWWPGFIQINQEPWEHVFCSSQCLTYCFSLNSGLEAPCLGTRVRPGNEGDSGRGGC